MFSFSYKKGPLIKSILNTHLMVGLFNLSALHENSMKISFFGNLFTIKGVQKG